MELRDQVRCWKREKTEKRRKIERETKEKIRIQRKWDNRTLIPSNALGKKKKTRKGGKRENEVRKR